MSLRPGHFRFNICGGVQFCIDLNTCIGDFSAYFPACASPRPSSSCLMMSLQSWQRWRGQNILRHFFLFLWQLARLEVKLVSPKSIPLGRGQPDENSFQPRPDTLKSSLGPDNPPLCPATLPPGSRHGMKGSPQLISSSLKQLQLSESPLQKLASFLVSQSV